MCRSRARDRIDAGHLHLIVRIAAVVGIAVAVWWLVTMTCSQVEMLVLGAVPLVLGTMAVERLRSEPMDRRRTEPDPA